MPGEQSTGSPTDEGEAGSSHPTAHTADSEYQVDPTTTDDCCIKAGKTSIHLKSPLSFEWRNAAWESRAVYPSLQCIWTRGTYSKHGYKVIVEDVKLSETTMAALRVWDGLPPSGLTGKARSVGVSVSDSPGSQRANVWDVLLDLGARRKRGEKLGILCQVSFERLSSDLAFDSAKSRELERLHAAILSHDWTESFTLCLLEQIANDGQTLKVGFGRRTYTKTFADFLTDTFAVGIAAAAGQERKEFLRTRHLSGDTSEGTQAASPTCS